MKKIKILGQDPSMQNWGVSVLELDLDTFELTPIAQKVLTNKKKDSAKKKQVRQSSIDFERASDLYKDLHEFIQEHNPAFTMVEMPVGSQSASAMKGYGIVMGVLGSLAQYGYKLPVVQVSELENKINAVGKRTATKKEMIEWAMKKYPNADWKTRKLKGEVVSVDGYNEHLADAIGAADAGIQSDTFLNAVRFFITD